MYNKTFQNTLQKVNYLQAVYSCQATENGENVFF